MTKFDESKSHYESLISLHKYVITIAAAFFGIIGVATYVNGKELREAQEFARESQRQEISELRKELNDQAQILSDDLTRTADNTADRALTEIENVKVSASIVAKDEAQKTILDVLDRQNIEGFIENELSLKYKSELMSIIDNKIQDLDSIYVNTAIKNLSSGLFNKRLEGMNFLSSNQEVFISDEQFNKLVSLIDYDHRWDEIDYRLIEFLENQDSPSLTIFFREKINESPKTTTYLSAVRYFLSHNYGHEIILKSIENFPTDNRQFGFYFEQLVKESAKYNPDFTIRLLNEKKYVDLVKIYDGSTSSDFRQFYVEPLIDWLTQYISQSDLKSTYFYLGE